MTNAMKLWVLIVTGIPAGLCPLVLPLWVLGVPGIDNEYARGWKMGASVIILYPVAWISVFGLGQFLKWMTNVDKATLDVAVSICLLILLGSAILRLWCAFRHILRS